MVIGELAISSVALSPIYGDEVYCSVAQFDDDPFVSLLWTDWPYSLRFHPIIFSQIKERLPKMRNVATFYMAEKNYVDYGRHNIDIIWSSSFFVCKYLHWGSVTGNGGRLVVFDCYDYESISLLLYVQEVFAHFI